MIGPRRLAHLNLFVSDLERSAAFYQEVCGFQEVFREEGIHMAFLSNGNSHHDLALMETTTETRVGRDGHVQVSTGRGRVAGLNHLGFEMETEAQLVEAFRRARQAGVRIDRTTDHQISHSMYLYDGDGHMLEFYADVALDWRALYRQLEGALISGAWDPEAAEPLTESRTEESPDIQPRAGSVLPARATTCAGLPVNDLETSLAFYTDVIGLSPDPTVGGDDWALLSGSGGTPDVCLVERRDLQATRLLFGGIQMESGRPIRDAYDALRRQQVPAAVVGDDETGALVVGDPDGITLVYSVAGFRDVMDECRDAFFDTVSRAL